MMAKFTVEFVYEVLDIRTYDASDFHDLEAKIMSDTSLNRTNLTATVAMNEETGQTEEIWL